MWQPGRRQPLQGSRIHRPPGLSLNVQDLEEPHMNHQRLNNSNSTRHDPPLVTRPESERRFRLPFSGSSPLTSDPFADDGKRIKVELFTNENSTRENLYLFVFKNKSVNITVCAVYFSLKLLTCILYVVRVVLDDASEADCYGCNNRPCKYLENFIWPTSCSEMEGNSEILCWYALLWVQNPPYIWGIQVAIAFWTLIQTLIFAVLKYRGDIWKVIDFYFLLELIIAIPFIITLFFTPWRNLFIPVFLNCWLAKYIVEYVFTHHRVFQSDTLLSQQVLFVLSTFICLAFTSICGFQHIQRVGCRRYNFFESFYFVAVTLSTVGYGDLFPDIWLSRLFMVLMIGVVLAVMPKKFESLAYSWMERKKIGGAYRKPKRRRDRHVVVSTTQVTPEHLTDFLMEFFSYRQLMDVSVVFLSPSVLDIETRQVLMSPVWTQKVMYIKGSCLKDADLRRVRMKEADACFILGSDPSVSKTISDEHTILRSWAVKDFAPNVPQYVQIYKPESKVHVKFAEFLVCEDEIKYAMLAYNCMCPGASTLITLLLHTTRGEEGQSCDDEWIRLYGKGSGNELYHVIVKDSHIFSEYEGKSFTYTSLHTHRKYGVALIGVKSFHEGKPSYIKLNPGSSHVMKATDVCYYISMTREENMNFRFEDKPSASAFSSKLLRAREILFGRSLKTVQPATTGAAGVGRVSDRAHGKEELNTTRPEDDDLDEYPEWIKNIEECQIIVDYPRVSPYLGASPTLCHVRTEKKRSCCMELDKVCSHCSHINAQQYEWKNREIILVAESATSGIYNFIVPLRAQCLLKSSLQPIILLLEKRPDQSFLDALSWFPLIYFMQGCIQNLDDLLRAGIIMADSVVVLNKESDSIGRREEDLADSNTIVAVQSVLEFFPKVNITTELSQSSNMRFMHFQASNSYALYLSEIEQKEKEKGSNISFMFRLQFASGNVFSASMTHTLLYQAFVKDYIITIIRLLLGIDQAPGSGYLASVKVSRQQYKEFATYGALFAELSMSSGAIPICIYRTQTDVKNSSPECEDSQSLFSSDNWENFTKDVQSAEVSNLVTSRLENLGIKQSGYDFSKDSRTSVSYVIINPSCDLNIEEDDIIFVLRPSRLQKFPTYRRTSMASRSTQTQLKVCSSEGLDDSYVSLQSHPSSFDSSGTEIRTIRPPADYNSRPRASPTRFDHFAYQY